MTGTGATPTSPHLGRERNDGFWSRTWRSGHSRRGGSGISWVVERSFAWLSRYRRLNTIAERSKVHLIAFVEIAFISILSRRLKRLVVKELSA
jgi:transposase